MREWSDTPGMSAADLAKVLSEDAGPDVSRVMHANRIHFADKINERGEASALCFKTPRAIDLHTATWTFRTDAVTCADCRCLLSDPFVARRFAKWRTP
jgi:hypothetical protein